MAFETSFAFFETDDLSLSAGPGATSNDLTAKIPSEIKHLICKEVVRSDYFKETAKSLSVVSRVWQSQMDPVLFWTMAVRSPVDIDRLRNFFTTRRARTTAAGMPRVLYITPCEYDVTVEFLRLAGVRKNVQILLLDSAQNPRVHAIARLIPKMRSLKCLHISFDHELWDSWEPLLQDLSRQRKLGALQLSGRRRRDTSFAYRPPELPVVPVDTLLDVASIAIPWGIFEDRERGVERLPRRVFSSGRFTLASLRSLVVGLGKWWDTGDMRSMLVNGLDKLQELVLDTTAQEGGISLLDFGPLPELRSLSIKSLSLIIDTDSPMHATVRTAAVSVVTRKMACLDRQLLRRFELELTEIEQINPVDTAYIWTRQFNRHIVHEESGSAEDSVEEPTEQSAVAEAEQDVDDSSASRYSNTDVWPSSDTGAWSSSPYVWPSSPSPSEWSHGPDRDEAHWRALDACLGQCPALIAVKVSYLWEGYREARFQHLEDLHRAQLEDFLKTIWSRLVLIVDGNGWTMSFSTSSLDELFHDALPK